MAFSLNKIMLIGNLGKDAETRFTNNNISVSNFSLATTYGYKGKDGNWVNETTWHNIVAFNLSDYFKDNLKKGKKFYIEGRLSKRDYTDKEGIKRYSTEVVAERLIPLEAGGSGSSEGGGTVYSDESSTGGNTNEPDMSVDNNNDLPF
ncbi:MAG TPA: single-stranded DNA-binding protein [Ignavibacteriaceae bacterium]|nr:single-stranded DNA-binding protein [Ignavibacteriaceae bacterium]